MKKLLVVTNGYPNESGSNPTHSFVKGSVDELKEEYDRVDVVSPTPYYPQLLSWLDIGPDSYTSMNDFEDYTYDNVTVSYPTFFTAPTAYHRSNNARYAAKALSDVPLDDYTTVLAYFCDPAGLATQRFCETRGFDYHLVIQENSGWFEELANQPRVHRLWEEAKTIFRVNPDDIPHLETYNSNSHYVPNGYDPETFYPVSQETAREKLDLPREETILVNVASLKIHHKNQLNLLRGFKQIQDKHPSSLFLVGEGPDREMVVDEIQHLSLSEKVSLIGRVPHEQVNLWMNAADLFVLPSYHEGNPTVMFECMATGTPQVCSRVGGVAEELSGGLLIEDPSDSSEIAQAMRKALRTSWDEDEIIDASSKYTWSSIASTMLEKIRS